MAAFSVNLGFVQRAESNKSLAGVLQYQVLGRFSTLLTGLLLLTEAVTRAVLTSWSVLAYSAYNQVAALKFQQNQIGKVHSCGSKSWQCFSAILSPKGLGKTLAAIPYTALISGQIPSLISLGEKPKLETSTGLLTGKEREMRVRQGAALIQGKLDTEWKKAQEQMAKEEQGYFEYEEGNIHLIPGGKTETHNNKGWTIGVAHAQGLRPAMEDEHLIDSFPLKIGDQTHLVRLSGIFDGHSGSHAAKHLKKNFSRFLKAKLTEFNKTALTDEGIWNALKMTFVSLNERYKESGSLAGSTATVTMILDGNMWTANLGDSRTIFVKKDGTVLQLSEDAKPSDVRYQKGIMHRGGTVFWNDKCLRVNGRLAVARAFGDHSLKGAVSARPKITKMRVEKGHLLHACDGIWDVASTKQVGEAIHAHRTQSPTELAKNLVVSAFEAESGDNLSVLVVATK